LRDGARCLKKEPNATRKCARTIIREVERLFERFGLNAKEPAHYDQLRAIVLGEPLRGRGRPKRGTPPDLRLLGFLLDIVTYGRPPMTRTKTAASIRKYCMSKGVHLREWVSRFPNDRAIARRLSTAIQKREREILFWERHPRLTERLDIALGLESKRTTK
jgi:hypothetical protein